MPDDPKKIIVDDDWKAQARKEKADFAKKEDQQRTNLPEPSFEELLNILVMQAMAALGMLSGPGGQRMPPDLGAAKHFIDMLQLLEDKTKGNLTPEEQALLDQVLYQTRMLFVQLAGGGGGAIPDLGAPPAPPQA